MNSPLLKRTTAGDPDFVLLIKQLDHELWVELQEDQATYDQFNKVPDIQTAVIVYVNDKPVASGCFKQKAGDTVEIKRMFVQKPFRGQGLSKLVLHELETWAVEEGYHKAVLETSMHFTRAIRLYQTNGYSKIPNYATYDLLEESVCMEKILAPLKTDE